MVLQDIENTAPDSFSDNPSPSDNDPYASPSSLSHTTGERFDASAMPRPIPILGPFIGFSERAVRFKVDTTLKFAEKKLGRTLDGEEAQALAFHIYNLEKSKSYYAAAGLAGGVYRWYATMNTYQYPFYKPKIESIDMNKFGPFKGPAANIARQSWRFGLYALVAGQMGNIIGQLISQPQAAYATSVDPKLEQFGAELKAASGKDERANEQRSRMIEERRKNFEARRRQEGTGGMTPPYGRGQDRRQAPPASDDADDMSPTAGNEAWGSSSSSWANDFKTEEQTPPQRQPDPRARRQPAYTPNPSSPSSSPSSPFGMDADNDASPTGGLSTETTAPSRSGESSWDRLRRGAGPSGAAGSPSSSSGSQSERIQRFASSRSGASGSTVGDDFTFVSGKDARDEARDKAQREFDERLEQERRGGDFNEGSGKRW